MNRDQELTQDGGTAPRPSPRRNLRARGRAPEVGTWHSRR
jgi:hypothetical protein